MQTSQPAQRTKQRNKLIGVSFVLLSACGFSAKAILIKLAYAYGQRVDAITLMALRMLLAWPVFLCIGLYRNKREQHYRLRCKDWLTLMLLGMLGYYLSSLLDFSGLQLIPAGLERLILFLYPTFVVLFGAVLRRRWIQGHQIIALLLSYSGMILVFIDNMQSNSEQVLLGSLMVLSSAIIFACFILGSAVMIKRIGSTRFTAFSMSFACLMTIIHYVIQHGMAFPDVPEAVYYLALLMAMLCTVMPSFLMNAGIHRIGAGNASIISAAGPVATLILAYFILGEQINAEQIAGTILVLSGVYVVSRSKE